MANAIEILLRAKNESDAAFNALAKNLLKTQTQTKKTDDALASSSAKYAKLSDAVGKTTTTLARSADAFGLNANAMRALNDVADVAQLGFENLTTATAGFNAASIGAAGAGLALGTAIGTMLRDIPAVADAADRAAVAFTDWFARLNEGAKAAVLNLSPLAGLVGHAFGAAAKSADEAAAATANWTIKQKEYNAAYEELLRKQTAGLTAEQAKLKLGLEVAKTGKDLILQEIRDREDKAKKAEALALKEAMGFDAANRKAEADLKASLERQLRDRKAAMDALGAEEHRLTGIVQAEQQAREALQIQGILEQAEAYQELVAIAERMSQDVQKTYEDIEARARQAWEDQIDAMFDVANAANDLGSVLGGVFGDLISQAGNFIGTLANVRAGLDQIKNSGGGLTGLLGKIGGGLGVAASVISFGKGLFDSLFGGAKKAREEMDKLRKEFISSQGGMTALSIKAREAGIALDAMFKAKSANQLQAAIAGIKSQLDLWEEGQDAINDAMEKYNISVSEMGPKFQQQELDKRAAEVAKAFGVLAAAGADAALIASKMGGDVLELVKQYQTAGMAIPAALRPVLEAMLKNGQLVDENGEAFTSLEDAGIKFAESMTEAMTGLMAKIEQMIQVLARGFNVPINFDYTTNGSPPAGPGGQAPDKFPEFAVGGIVARRMPAIVGDAGPEAILPLNQQTFQQLGAATASALAPYFAQMMMSGNNTGRGGSVYLDGVAVGRVMSQQTRKGTLRVHPSAVGAF